MIDRVFARAMLLAGEMDAKQQAVLRLLCESEASCLAAELKEGLTAEDCGEDFVTAAAFRALAAMEGFGAGVREFRAGDLTVKTAAAGAGDLRRQADRLMAPYRRDRFAFTGV